jgi:hypothetical protein
MIYLDESTEINYLPIQAVKHLTVLNCSKRALKAASKTDEEGFCAAQDVAISIMEMVTKRPIIQSYDDWSCRLSAELFRPKVKIDNENDMSFYQACLNHLEVDMRMLFDPKNQVDSK